MPNVTETNARPQGVREEIDTLIALVADGLRVLRVRDGLPIDDALAMERARNIVTGLLGEFEIVPRDPIGKLDARLATMSPASALSSIAGRISTTAASIAATAKAVRS